MDTNDYIEIRGESIFCFLNGMPTEFLISDIKKIDFYFLAKESYYAKWTIELPIENKPSKKISFSNETSGTKDTISKLSNILPNFDLPKLNELVRDGTLENAYEVWPKLTKKTCSSTIGQRIYRQRDDADLDKDNLSQAELENIYRGLRTIIDNSFNQKFSRLVIYSFIISLCVLLFISPWTFVIVLSVTLALLLFYNVKFYKIKCPRCYRAYSRRPTEFDSPEPPHKWTCQYCHLRMNELPEFDTPDSYKKPDSIFG